MKKFRQLFSLLVAGCLGGLPCRAYALPTNGAPTNPADASLSTAAGTMTITQNVNKAIINYDTFNIASGETVNFNQPSASAIALNRVALSGGTSNILGSLNANGQIFLLNPNGIIFGAGSKIDTAGMIASSLALSDVNFLAGNYAFSGSGGAVINQGTLNAVKAPGGYVALLGCAAENAGVITTTGSIALAGGKAITVSLDASGLVNVVVNTAADVNPAAKSDQITNSGRLSAGDKVFLNAQSLAGLFTNAVNNGGIIEGKSVAIDADGNVNISGTVTADAGTGYGVVSVISHKDITVAGTITAKGQENHVVDMAESLMHDVAGTKTYFPTYSYGSKIALTADGTISVGNMNADYVLVNSVVAGSVFDLGKIQAHLLVLAAKNDIGTKVNPIRTDVDILAGYSYGKGNIYINEDNTVTLGFYLPVDIVDSFGTLVQYALGMSLAANDGIIWVQSGDSITINSVLCPRGGVFLQSTGGSLYAGTGWLPQSGNPSIDPHVPWPKMNIVGTAWETIFTKQYAPIVLPLRNWGDVVNVTAGSYSYFSSLSGTIGEGTPSVKNPAMSGAISGSIGTGVTAVTGVALSPALDPIYGYPPGFVVYRASGSGSGSQIYPATLSPSALPISNPIKVNVKLVNSLQPAWRDGFTTTAGLTLQFGSPVPNPADSSAAALNRNLRAYYEILSLYRLVAFEPGTPTTFFAYHPLTPTDSSSFDNITLDAGFYQFLDNTISLSSPLNPYFGSTDEDTAKKKK